MVAKVEVAVLAFIIIGGAVATFIIIAIITVAIAAGLHEPLAIAAQVEGAALAFIIVSGTMYQLWLSLLMWLLAPLNHRPWQPWKQAPWEQAPSLQLSSLVPALLWTGKLLSLPLN